MRFRGESGANPQAGEAALTSENILLVLIGACIVAGIAWVALRDSEGTEREAREYADRTLQHLLVAHDAAYLAANLSARGHVGYPESQQKLIIYELKKLGAPTAPWRLDGKISYGSAPGEHVPLGHFEATAKYPAADAHFYLEVINRFGHWRIDSFTAMWKDKSAPVVPNGI